MKKGTMVAMMMLSAFLAMAQGASSAKISLADARSRIDRIIAAPATIKETIKQLSAADQTSFLAEVNKAVREMPGSLEERTALYLSLNMVAVSSAEKGNSATLLAEVFATVPPESLTVLSERFAVDLLSRTANQKTVVSDAQYEAIASNVVEKVRVRCEETDNCSVRVTLAILMFVRASGGTSETLVEHLIEMIKDEEAKELARNEWIPSALGGEGRESNYDSLLASADAGRRPDPQAVLVIAGPLYGAAVIGDLNGKNTEADMFSHTKTPILDAVENAFGQQAARAGDEKIGGASAAGGAINGAAIETGGIGGGGTDTRPTPQNPDPQETGNTPIVPVVPTPTPAPTPVPPGPYPYQTY